MHLDQLFFIFLVQSHHVAAAEMAHCLPLYVVVIEFRPVQLEGHSVLQPLEEMEVARLDLGEVTRPQYGLVDEVLLIPLPDSYLHPATDHIESVPFVPVLMLAAHSSRPEVDAVEFQHAIGVYQFGLPPDLAGLI